MTPWDRGPSDETDAKPPQIVACWSRETGAGTLDHRVELRLDETAAQSEALVIPLQRMICHVLVDQLPDQGLGELVESLVGMVDFYAVRSTQPSLGAPARPARSRVLGHYERPVFQVTED
jgi:hypothetical protein